MSTSCTKDAIENNCPCGEGAASGDRLPGVQRAARRHVRAFTVRGSVRTAAEHWLVDHGGVPVLSMLPPEGDARLHASPRRYCSGPGRAP